ncbi:holin family protein [Pleionea sediminis]|uniref:holin family protein n=1 Tax=Pleionea sediminis TaxID=2569479 RepID=UPI0011858405|nr:holin family protein [Pleionea sediminis]
MAHPALIGGVFEIGKQLIDRIWPDETDKAEAQLKLLLAQQNGDLKQLETRLSAILAEANSSDPWTSRARPSFLYVIYIFILSAIPMGFLFAFEPTVAERVTHGVTLWLQAIPTELYTLFGAGFLGYAHYRSKDKHTQKNTQ